MGEEVTNFIRAIEGDGQLRKQLIVGEAVDLGEQSRRVLPGSEDDKRLPHAVMDFSLSINLNAPGTANKEAEE